MTKKEKVPLWNEYRIQWTFITRLCGQTPANPNILKIWIENRQPRVKPAGAKSISEINEEVYNSIRRGDDAVSAEEQEELSKLVFAHDDAGNLAMRASTVRAHLKDCARVLSAQYIGRVEGERAFSTRVKNGLYPANAPYWIPILDSETGKPKRVPDGDYEQPIHVSGPRGTRSAIKCFDYVVGARMNFTILVLGKSVSEDDLHTLFQYGGVHGYAGERSNGEGKYTYTIEKVIKQEKVA